MGFNSFMTEYMDFAIEDMINYHKENKLMIDDYDDTDLYQYIDITKYLESSNELSSLYLEEVFKINYFLRDNLQIPKVKPQLSKPSIRDNIIEFTGNFMNTHTRELSTSGPVHVFQFGNKETDFLYNTFNLSKEELLNLYKKLIDETYNGTISSVFKGMITSAPHKLLVVAILIESIQNNYKDIVECCEYLFGFMDYPMLYRKSFSIGVKEDVMDYTIEHLPNKFKIKTKNLNSLQSLLKYDIESSINNKIEQLKTGVDNVYLDLLYRIRNQIKGTIINIAREYYNNIEKNASTHVKSGKYDDGSNVDAEGYGSNLPGMVENTFTKFQSSSINSTMVKVASEWSQVDKDNLTRYLNQILSSKDNRLYKFIESIGSAFMMKNQTNSDIGSTEFLNFGLALYKSISTSKNSIYQEIKSILNYWMFDIIKITNDYQREATIINYTRSIFNYMILMIHSYN